jgi:hypothetical protein
MGAFHCSKVDCNLQGIEKLVERCEYLHDPESFDDLSVRSARLLDSLKIGIRNAVARFAFRAKSMRACSFSVKSAFAMFSSICLTSSSDTPIDLSAPLCAATQYWQPLSFDTNTAMDCFTLPPRLPFIIYRLNLVPIGFEEGWMKRIGLEQVGHHPEGPFDFPEHFLRFLCYRFLWRYPDHTIALLSRVAATFEIVPLILHHHRPFFDLRLPCLRPT